MISKENHKDAIQQKPSLNGLVLAGGRSMRMGKDKSILQWHGKEQRYYEADLLQKFCNAVYISCRKEQQTSIDCRYQTIADAYEGLGPYGAILSAFCQQESCAWLVIACDLPLLDAETVSYLIQYRNADAMATTFESPYDGLPEPLITIWEPKSYPVLLSFLSGGYTCPRKILINNDVKIIKAQNEEALMNVNTPQEFEKAHNLLR